MKEGKSDRGPKAQHFERSTPSFSPMIGERVHLPKSRNVHASSIPPSSPKIAVGGGSCYYLLPVTNKHLM